MDQTDPTPTSRRRTEEGHTTMDSYGNPPIQWALMEPLMATRPATPEVASTLRIQETILDGVSFLHRHFLRQGVRQIDSAYVYIFFLRLIRNRYSRTQHLSHSKHAIPAYPASPACA